MRKSIHISIFILIISGLILGCSQPEQVPVADSQKKPAESVPAEKKKPASDNESEGTSGSTGTAADRIPLIFSHDGAPDDISTLVYIARHPQINLLGVVNSYGEQHPSISKSAWQVFLYDVIDDDGAAFGVGSDTSVDPEQNEFPQGWREGADNFWGMDLPAASEEYTVANGADLIIDLVKNSPEKVTILILGGHTDMALALQKDESIADNISQIVIMGGAFNVPGNLYESPGYEHNRVAEWNIYADPLAAKIVFNSGIPLSIVSLDGSDDFVLGRKDLNKIWDSTDPALSLLSALWEQSFDWWGGPFKIWDIVAGVAVTNPEHMDWTYDGVDVVAEPGNKHGQTIALNTGSETSRFSASTDFRKVNETVFSVILAEPEKAASPPSATEERSLNDLAGTWRGSAVGSDASFEITFSIDSDCQLNEICGSYNLLDFDITGDVRFVASENGKFVFESVNKTDGSGLSYEEYLRFINDDELEYFSRGDYGTSEGVLKRE